MKCRRQLVWLLGGIAALALPASYIVGKVSIERSVTSIAERALDRPGLEGVTVFKVDGQAVVLTGPASLKDSAIKAFVVGNGELLWGIEEIRYQSSLERNAPQVSTTTPSSSAPSASQSSASGPAISVSSTSRPSTSATATPTSVPFSLPSLQGIQFEVGSAIITQASYPILNAAIDALKRRPDIKVEVQGHTDNRGEPAENLLLSDARARAVRNYLVFYGLEPEQITAVGFGSTKPIAVGDNEAAWQQNRRIEFKIRES